MLRVSRPDFRTQTGPHVVTLANIQQCLRVINRSLDQIPSNTDMFQSFEGMRNVLQELVTHFRIINDSFEESLQNALFTTQSVPFVYYVKMLCDVPRIGLSLGKYCLPRLQSAYRKIKICKRIKSIWSIQGGKILCNFLHHQVKST